LAVTTAAPNTIVRNTAKNISAPSEEVLILKVNDKVMHKNIGPHKSPVNLKLNE